jgi:XTP/dITP diphosphohydrolase
MIEAYGKCDGSIAFEPSGVNGFGYDPVFIWKNGRTFAQMTAEEKDKVSHRSMAINDFRIKLEKYLMKKGGSNNDDK